MPGAVEQWAKRARWFRALDAVAAYAFLWAIVATALPTLPADMQVVGAALVLVLLALVGPVRVAWRPVTACFGLALSRGLRPGDRAWYVAPGHAERVLVTGRRFLHVIIVAGGGHGAVEGISVRRTRVLLIPDERVTA